MFVIRNLYLSSRQTLAQREAMVESLVEWGEALVQRQRAEAVEAVKAYSLWRNLNHIERLELEQMIRGLR